VRESMSTGVIIWVNTILNHIDIKAVLPRYEDSCMVYRPEWYDFLIFFFGQILIPYWYPKM
jgi:hypothetical protein